MPRDRSAVDLDVLGLTGAGETWGNLGFWKDQKEYPRACEALARELGKAAGLSQGAHVLDVGMGCGDQLVLWVKSFGAARVVGRDVVHQQVELATKRVKREGLSDVILCEVGSGTERSSLPDGSVDRVLSLDSAYHFNLRRDFLREALRVLKEGGRVAWTDMVLPRPLGKWGERVLEPVCNACDIPTANIKTVPELESEIKLLGFVDVNFRFLEEHVFAGFARFARAHRNEHLRGFPDGAWTKLMMTGWACEQIWKRQLLHYAVVTARRR